MIPIAFRPGLRHPKPTVPRQAGTYEYDACFAVAVRPTDGAALLAGYSQGTWDGTANYNGYSAGVLLETGSEEATLAPVSSTTPSPVISATLSPVVSVTPSPFTITTPTAGTLSPQPAVTTNDDSSDTASVCGEGESFRIVSSELPGIQGCYEITSLTYADGGTMEAYTTDGMVDFEEIWVFGTIDDETVRMRAQRRCSSRSEKCSCDGNIPRWTGNPGRMIRWFCKRREGRGFVGSTTDANFPCEICGVDRLPAFERP